MIVLHAGVVDNELHLWGERSDPGEQQVGQSARRSKSVTKPNGHERFPYDAGTQALSAAMVDAGVASPPAKHQIKNVTAWLPTQAGRCIPSSPLVGDILTSGGKTQIAPWRVSAIRLTPRQSVEMLCACVGKQVLAPGVVVGNDLAFWAMAVRLAGATVTRQQFLPDIMEESGQYRACWKPVFAGRDAEAPNKLATAMPAVARALSANGAERRPRCRKEPPMQANPVRTAKPHRLIPQSIRLRPPVNRVRRKIEQPIPNTHGLRALTRNEPAFLTISAHLQAASGMVPGAAKHGARTPSPTRGA